MYPSRMFCPRALRTLFIAATALAANALAAPLEPVWSLAQKEKPALLDTLKQLVEIESGSADREGLDRIKLVQRGKLTLFTIRTCVRLIKDNYTHITNEERVGVIVRMCIRCPAHFSVKGIAITWTTCIHIGRKPDLHVSRGGFSTVPGSEE